MLHQDHDEKQELTSSIATGELTIIFNDYLQFLIKIDRLKPNVICIIPMQDNFIGIAFDELLPFINKL